MKNPAPLNNDPFGRVDGAAAAAMALSLDTREGRIAVLAWVAEELLASSDPRKKFVGSALRAGLEDEDAHVGDLERKYLQIAGGRGCTVSPAKVLRLLRRR